MNEESISKAHTLSLLLQQCQINRERARSELECRSLDMACEKLASELKAAVGGDA